MMKLLVITFTGMKVFLHASHQQMLCQGLFLIKKSIVEIRKLLINIRKYCLSPSNAHKLNYAILI